MQNVSIKKTLKYIYVFVLLLLMVSCKYIRNTGDLLAGASETDCGCDSLWSKPSAKQFVTVLEKTTISNHPVWKGYSLGEAAIVLNAGSLNDTTNCLGLWKNGKPVSYKCSKDIPTMLTPLYSYYINYKNTTNADSTFFVTGRNAPVFSSWMSENKIESAVYMPVDFPEFPFEISAMVKVQLAIHEVFHIEVMLRKWYTNKGFWPEWERQPDRAGMLSCYEENESVKKMIEDEQESLALLIEALLDHKKQDAVFIGNKFSEIREARYNALKDNQIILQNDIYGDCKTVESLMEIEEGIADYASWVKMYDIGVVSRSDLLKRYRAKQKDKFYLTGCMLFHSSVLMNGGNDVDIMTKMVTANSIEEGNLFKIFKEQLVKYGDKGAL